MSEEFSACVRGLKPNNEPFKGLGKKRTAIGID
jgi:hypothetical protein